MTDRVETKSESISSAFLEEGAVVGGRYRVQSVLGTGGFAQVYLASHLEVESLQVAVKVLHPHRATPDTIARFRREAKLMAMLRNRHIVRLMDFGFQSDTAYLVMEYVRGTPLDRVILAHGPMHTADVTRVGIGVAKALVEAHDVGVLHRDLKPGNIIFVAEPGERHPVPRVLDFGIAKVLGSTGDPRDLSGLIRPDGTFEGRVYCTPAYAAPELLRGKPDYRTDLYALGLVLTEMMEGELPYDWDGDDMADSPHLWPEPVPLGQKISRSPLRPIIERAVAKELDDRYADAREMLQDLERVYRGGKDSTPSPPPLSLNDLESRIEKQTTDPLSASRVAKFVETSRAVEKVIDSFGLGNRAGTPPPVPSVEAAGSAMRTLSGSASGVRLPGSADPEPAVVQLFGRSLTSGHVTLFGVIVVLAAAVVLVLS